MPETKPKTFTSIGGQAILEGVMMRSPGYVAFAVRRPDGRIQVRSRAHPGISARFPILKLPVLRGVTTLLESMRIGMEALGYSAEIADPAAKPADDSSKGSRLAIAVSIGGALLMGLGLFVVLPHVLANLVAPVGSGALFHLIDGLIKVAILLLYVYGISLLPDIRRVFQFHGAEHKSIYAFEAGLPLEVASARIQSTLHPRCGTSFLLFLVLISVAVFTAFFPIVGISEIVGQSLLGHAATIVLKFFLMLPVAGIAYEVIKLCACRMDRLWFRMLVWPGLKLQLLTTRAPDDQQLEVALVSLKEVLLLEKGEIAPGERTYGNLGELAAITATVAEFKEA